METNKHHYILIVHSPQQLAISQAKAKAELEADVVRCGHRPWYLPVNKLPTDLRALTSNQKELLGKLLSHVEQKIVVAVWLSGGRMTMYHSIILHYAIRNQCTIAGLMGPETQTSRILTWFDQSCRRLRIDRDIDRLGQVLPFGV